MVSRGAAAGLLFLLLVAATYSQQSRLAKIDYRNRNSVNYRAFPFCKILKITQDASDPEKSSFTCEQCDDGFEPNTAPYIGKTIPGTDIIDFGDGSTEPKVVCTLKMLNPPNTDPKGNLVQADCGHEGCRSFIPQCKRFASWKNGKVADRQTPIIYCTECEDPFEPLPYSNQTMQFFRGEINTNRPYDLCMRKEETRECGEQCEKEMPGCLAYQTERKDEFESRFRCVKTLPGLYPINHGEYQTNYISTSIQKLLVDISFAATPTPVVTRQQRHQFPNCKEYFSILAGKMTTTYYCTGCRDGYRVKPPVTKVVNFIGLILRDAVQLCEIEEFQNKNCDEVCQEELPGCSSYSVWDVKNAFTGNQFARYRCEQCKLGYEKVVDDSLALVHNGWFNSENVKVRCRPQATNGPMPCDSDCRKKFPNCRMYSTSYDTHGSTELELFECKQCDDDYEPTEQPDAEPFYIGYERTVCRRKPTNGRINCDQNCKENFPNCDVLEVTEDSEGHNTYTCHQCQSGFFPINYEDPTPGVLSQASTVMRSYNTFYLCSDKPNEYYLEKIDCNDKDPSMLDSKECHVAANCQTIIRARNLSLGRDYLKCMKCQNGLQPKKVQPRLYDSDQSLCETTK